ncbi:hypothetical protein JKF63_06349 [Porcisia hertigi]|uniref:Serine/threonine specific protein phosphatases domain-containing protein n=1 Tax=Porcisia hertigi TaxID=2761500 RepID=A0A836LF26_9TRYP|nr:hypothetical protein JKF63_06349 [Porcisia hertigi]
MDEPLQLTALREDKDEDVSLRAAPLLSSSCLESSVSISNTRDSATTSGCGSSSDDFGDSPNGLRVRARDLELHDADISCEVHRISLSTSSMYPSNTAMTNVYATTSGCHAIPFSGGPQEAVPRVSSGAGRASGFVRPLKIARRHGNMCSAPCNTAAEVHREAPNCLKSLDNAAEVLSPPVFPSEKNDREIRSATPLGLSQNSTDVEDLQTGNLHFSSSGEAEDGRPFFRTAPRSGVFVPLIEWLLRRGRCGGIGSSAASQNGGSEYTQADLFNKDYISKLCAAATAVLAKEPTLLMLEVLAHDTLVVVGDIHGQFQDLYTSVLCQQYDQRRCNLDGRDRRFLFMGDYVDRGPHSLEVVLLLLALKVEYPTLVYLTRGNHEEEKTSRVYGFLTEAIASLGSTAGTAVWNAINQVFLDLPLAAIVQTPYMRFFVSHGGLSPALQTVDQVARIERHAYSVGELTKEDHDIVDGLLWSDPCTTAGLFAASSRGCGWNFGPAASSAFCSKNKFNFICRAHEVAMDGYFWTHNDRVVTVFSAPNYCGINNNRGAIMVVSGEANKPSFEQYDYYNEMSTSFPDALFPQAEYFF